MPRSRCTTGTLHLAARSGRGTTRVTILGAWKNVHGQDELDDLFELLAERFSDCTSYEFDLVVAEVRGDTA